MGGVLRRAVLLLFLIVCGYPLLWMAFSSVRTEGAARERPLGLPLRPTAANYATVLRSGSFGRAYLNSAIVCGVSVTAGVIFSAMAAYAFARMRFRGSGLLFMLFLGGMMIPIHVTLVPLNMLMRPSALGLKGTHFALIGPYLGFALPISILVLRGAFEGVPIELEEAARLDGCSTWGVFWRVALPLVRPALATVIIFNLLTMWNEFAFALVLISDASLRTLPLALWEFRGEHDTNVAETCAALCVAVAPLLLVYCLAQKHIIRGLTAGALKQ